MTVLPLKSHRGKVATRASNRRCSSAVAPWYGLLSTDFLYQIRGLSWKCRPCRVGKKFRKCRHATRRRYVGDMSGRHVGDMVVVVALFGTTPLAPCRHAHNMSTTWLKVHQMHVVSCTNHANTDYYETIIPLDFIEPNQYYYPSFL